MLRKSESKSSKKDLISKSKKMEKEGSHVGSKWNKTNVLIEDQMLSRYIPVTQRFSLLALKSMLNNFKMVYVKPVKGTYGNGIMRVEKQEENGEITFDYQAGTKKKHFDSFLNLYRSIMNHKMKRKYLIQQGIHLLKYHKCLFDIRIMVQKSSKGIWKSTGIIGLSLIHI